MCCMALARRKDGKSVSESALALRVTPRAVTQWLKWFVDEGLDRVAGIPANGYSRYKSSMLRISAKSVSSALLCIYANPGAGCPPSPSHFATSASSTSVPGGR